MDQFVNMKKFIKSFKKYLIIALLSVLALDANESGIYEYEIRFKNKIGPLSIDGLKTFSKKELSLSKNFNTKLISMSPFVEDNTTLRIKDETNIDSQESIKVVFSRKDIIQSWVKVLSKLENPVAQSSQKN